MKKILVTGHTGMLGSAICEDFKTDFEVWGIGRSPNLNMDSSKQVLGDLTNFEFLKKALDQIQPDCIIHTAAIVNVDFCEKNKEFTDLFHIRLSDFLAKNSQKLIYISTDSVFDGQKGNYQESDEPNPLNYYAQSKREGEKAVLASNSNHVVLRTNMYGFKQGGRSLAEWIVESLQQNQVINGFTDVFFNPLYTRQIASVIKGLLAIRAKGIWHVGSQEQVSKYDFALALADCLGLEKNNIVPKSIDSLTFEAPRPKNTTLSTCIFELAFLKPISLKAGLEAFKADFLKK